MTNRVRGNTSNSTNHTRGTDRAASAPSTTAAPPADDIEDFPVEAEAGPAVDAFLKLANDEMGGMYVSDNDVTTIMNHLATLSPGQQRMALEALRDNGKLDTLCDQCPDNLRGTMCNVLARAGLMSEKAHPSAPTHGDNKTTPPTVPSLFSVPKGASDAVRKLAMATNTDRASEYRDAFVDYRDAYRQAVRDCPTVAALRQLGNIQEPGLPLANPAGVDRDYESLATRMPDVKTAEVVTDKLYELNQMSAPGVDLGIAVKVQLGYETNATAEGGVQAKAGVELSAAAGSYRDGSTDSSVGGQAQVAVGRGTDDGQSGDAKKSSFNGVQASMGVSRSTARDGTTADNANASAGVVTSKTVGGASSSAAAGGNYDATTGNSATMGGNTLDKTTASMTVGESGVSGQVSAMGTGMAISGGPGTASVTVGVAGQSASVSKGPGGTSVSATVGVPGAAQVTSGYSSGSVAANGHQQGPTVTTSATVGGSVSKGPVTAEAQVTVGMTAQLVSVDDAKLMIAKNESDVFDTPAELLRGQRFEDMPIDKQKLYTFYGWNKDSWAAAQQQQRDKSMVAAQRVGLGR
jgi:hypothetical protein